MNYLILKSIVEATLSHFSCRNCGSKATEKDIQVLGSVGNALNLEITCPNCKANGVVKAEVNVLGQHSVGEAKAFFEGMKRGAELSHEGPAIRDEDIVALRETLKKSSTVKDLLK
jgi:hypothetical protein